MKRPKRKHTKHLSALLLRPCISRLATMHKGDGKMALDPQLVKDCLRVCDVLETHLDAGRMELVREIVQTMETMAGIRINSDIRVVIAETRRMCQPPSTA
jgi:hypothetical protein